LSREEEKCGRDERLTVLDKSDIRSLFTEALSADVETVFSDYSCFVGADTACSGAFSIGFGS